ncbi:MAG TPA: hypothetical protein VMT08_31435 [Bradyrhizobium sp.]|nr:hypothetical protein [Bradyrhizobium sp.]
MAAGRAAGSTKACVAAGFASLSSAGLLSAAVGRLVGSVSVGGFLASAVAGALLASAVVEALLASGASGALLISVGADLVSASLEGRSAALCRSMKSLQVNGKTISPEAVTPIGVQPPGGGPASEDPVRGSEVWATPSRLIPNKTDSVAAKMRGIANKCLIATTQPI